MKRTIVAMLAAAGLIIGAGVAAADPNFGPGQGNGSNKGPP
jgi:hypothetical protein